MITAVLPHHMYTLASYSPRWTTALVEVDTALLLQHNFIYSDTALIFPTQLLFFRHIADFSDTHPTQYSVARLCPAQSGGKSVRVGFSFSRYLKDKLSLRFVFSVVELCRSLRRGCVSLLCHLWAGGLFVVVVWVFVL